MFKISEIFLKFYWSLILFYLAFIHFTKLLVHFFRLHFSPNKIVKYTKNFIK